MSTPQAAALLSEEETERVARIVADVRRVQKVLGQCLDAGALLLEEMAEIGNRHGLKLVNDNSALPLGVTPDVAPPSRRRPD